MFSFAVDANLSGGVAGLPDLLCQFPQQPDQSPLFVQLIPQARSAQAQQRAQDLVIAWPKRRVLDSIP